MKVHGNGAFGSGRPSMDAVFRGNRLLNSMSDDLRTRVQPRGEIVHLDAGEALFNAGEAVSHALFPADGAMISLLVYGEDGRCIEVATVGREGVIGGVVSCGRAVAFGRARVQMAGAALRIANSDLDGLKQVSAELRNLLCRYSDFLLAQVMQLVACNAFHMIEERSARWLLQAQDRADSDRLVLTQEGLAGMLGVQRTTVNAVARELQGKGLIEYRRGEVRIIDRTALRRRTCECYGALHDHYDRVIGAPTADRQGDRS